MTPLTSLAPLLERFFTQRLMQQRQASPHTISSYRDTFRHFLKFARQRLQKPPSGLRFEEIDAPLIVAFLDDLERHGLSIRSRNLRLTAFHSFFRYAAFELPTHAAQIQRVLAIPSKRFTRTLVQFLTRAEVDALLAAPDQRTWFGRRDHAFLLVAVQTGLRVSEMTGLTRGDVVLGAGAHVRVIGKGRKERCTPLARPTRDVLKAWFARTRSGDGGRPLSQRHGQSAYDSRRPVHVEQTPSDGGPDAAVVDAQTRDRTPLEAHRRHGPAPGGRRSLRHCVVARPRVGRDHADLSGGDAVDEGTGARQDQPAPGPSRDVPPQRSTPGVSQQLVGAGRLCRVKRSGDSPINSICRRARAAA
jgi:site-specific recombinase XerD